MNWIAWLFFLPCVALAQTKTIRGIVYDESVPIDGAIVEYKARTKNDTTDQSGRFEISFDVSAVNGHKNRENNFKYQNGRIIFTNSEKTNIYLILTDASGKILNSTTIKSGYVEEIKVPNSKAAYFRYRIGNESYSGNIRFPNLKYHYLKSLSKIAANEESLLFKASGYADSLITFDPADSATKTINLQSKIRILSYKDGGVTIEWADDLKATAYNLYWGSGLSLSALGSNKIARITLPYTISSFNSASMVMGIKKIMNGVEEDYFAIKRFIRPITEFARDTVWTQKGSGFGAFSLIGGKAVTAIYPFGTELDIINKGEVTSGTDTTFKFHFTSGNGSRFSIPTNTIAYTNYTPYSLIKEFNTGSQMDSTDFLSDGQDILINIRNQSNYYAVIHIEKIVTSSPHGKDFILFRYKITK